MDTINFQAQAYPQFQAMGNAAQFAIPFAKHVCKGRGYDIGCAKKEWAFPGSIPIDVCFEDGWDAFNLPDNKVDYIFSSHCLEHIDRWVDAMDYWYETLKTGGTLFLYLPDYSQEYWRPWNNKKHLNIFSPQIIKDYMVDRGYHNIFAGSTDLNNSFMVMGENY
jgi:predicted SAM-dependent methyltransferase|tara:strand:+ start:1533 stop:2024 length:492 start_codon:yes stop_codon:yes gene_type:complete